MSANTNKEGQPGQAGLAQVTTTNVESLTHPTDQTRADPMHAALARNAGMAKVMGATSPVDRAAIAEAVLAGLDPEIPRRAEDALAFVRFSWPSAAPARCLGAIVAHLSRLGLIVEAGWTKGRTGRSHAGRVSMWLRRATV